MHHYRMYLFTDGHILWATDLHARDDEDAVRQAGRHAAGRPFEVWMERRLVKPHSDDSPFLERPSLRAK